MVRLNIKQLRGARVRSGNAGWSTIACSGTSQVTLQSLVKHMPALTSPKMVTMSLGLIVQMQPRQLKINGKHIASHASRNAIEMRASAERQQVLSPDGIYQRLHLLELYSFGVETIAKHVTSFYALDEKTIHINSEQKPSLLDRKSVV